MISFTEIYASHGSVEHVCPPRFVSLTWLGHIALPIRLKVLLMAETRRSPVEGQVVNIPLQGFSTIQTVVGNGISEASTVGYEDESKEWTG